MGRGARAVARVKEVRGRQGPWKPRSCHVHKINLEAFSEALDS